MDWNELKHNLETQGNRMTKHPLFVVYEKEKIPTHEDYADLYEYIDTVNDYTIVGTTKLEVIEYLKNDVFFRDDHDCIRENLYDEDFDQLCNKHDISKIYYIIKPRFVTACFTEKAAQAYIDANKHNLNDPYIYAESLNRNHEMIAVREALMEGRIK